MARGSKPGERRGGRKKGTPNKPRSTEERASEGLKKLVQRHLEPKGAEVAAHIVAQVEQALMDGKLPIPYMLEIMRDDTQPPTFRFEAAKAVAHFVHPKLSEVKSQETEIRRITEIRRVIVQHRIEHSDSPGIPNAAWRDEV